MGKIKIKISVAHEFAKYLSLADSKNIFLNIYHGCFIKIETTALS